jgi:hypothetical protein
LALDAEIVSRLLQRHALRIGKSLGSVSHEVESYGPTSFSAAFR